MISTMKVTSVLVGTLAAIAGAQDLSGFPECAQWCINSMQQSNMSQQLGCSANDAACACRNPNFLYGVRDCSAELCGSFETAGQAIGYANDYCRDKGVDLTSVTTGLPSQITNTNLPSGTGSASGPGSGSASATGTASQSAITTSAVISPIVSTISESGSTRLSTIGSTTIIGSGASGSGASGATETSTVPIVSTVTSSDTTFQTTVGSSTQTTTRASGTGGADNGGATGGNGGATTTGNPNYAPKMTAAPAGLLAAAGVAAFLF